MSDNTRQEQRHRGMAQIFRRVDGPTEIVTHMIQRHDHHHQSAQQVDRNDAGRRAARSPRRNTEGNGRRDRAHTFTSVVQEIETTLLNGKSTAASEIAIRFLPAKAMDSAPSMRRDHLPARKWAERPRTGAVFSEN